MHTTARGCLSAAPDVRGAGSWWVRALERYAAQVRVTDAARRDWQSALKIAGLNDRYLDLLARTAADDQAIAEITTLTGQASAADEALREGLHRAAIAAEALVLPVDDEP